MGILCVTNLDKMSQFDIFRPTYTLFEVYFLKFSIYGEILIQVESFDKTQFTHEKLILAQKYKPVPAD